MKLSEASLADVTFQAWAVVDGTADLGTHDANTTCQTFTVTIPAGETVAEVAFFPSGSFGTNEFDENFTLEITDSVNAVLAGGGPVLQATGVILDGNGGPDLALFVSDPVIVETDGAGQQAVFELRLSQPAANEITLSYTTADGSALAGEDYTAASGTITFAEGQTVAAVAVDILGDTDVETSEIFSLIVTPTAQIANNTFIGGAGTNTLVGGSGADVFVFDIGGDTDVITDFDLSEDVLQISTALAAGRNETQIEALAQEVGSRFEINLGNGVVIRMLNLDDLDGLSTQIDII